MGIFQLNNVFLHKGDKDILKDINLNIEKGEFITVIGPSGGGKTSLLRILGMLDSPTTGSVLYNGADIDDIDPMEYRKKIRYVFQKPYLFGKTVMDNIAFPFVINKKTADMDKVYEMMDLLGLPGDFINKDKDELSGGEQQRICLIRSLVIAPEVLLLDEVTASLDPVNTKKVEDFISHMIIDKEITVLAVTHNLDQAQDWGRKTICMDAGQVVHFMPTDQLFVDYKDELDKFRKGEE